MENLEQAILAVKEQFPGMKLLENEPMKAHSSFRIGGPVRALAAPSDVTSLTKLCDILKQHHIAPFILGNGTNILFPDEGLNDLFIISTEKLQKLFLLPDGSVYAEAGVSLARLAAFAQENGLTGLEFAGGIPGTLGGGCIMNAGAYGGELKDVVESVVFLYIPDQSLYELPNADCAFGYRRAIFRKPRAALFSAPCFTWPRTIPRPSRPACRNLARSAAPSNRWISPPQAVPSAVRRATMPPPSSRKPA